ncbi:MAG: hypothetical protein H7255_08990 [Ramlibacter sp.]|nr:hypothetical protein [Ramlibacter sp.]
MTAAQIFFAETAEPVTLPACDQDQIDSELEKHIVECGREIELAMARYAASSCFTDLGDAQHWEMAQKQAVGRRSAAMVLKLETARGLR